MKKAFIILLCALAVFAVVSCKNEPKTEPEPVVEKFTVTFNTGEGGPTVESATVEKGATVAKPTASKEGSYVKGWYTESTYEHEYNFETAVTADITLYAKWADDFDIVRLTATTGVNAGLWSYDKFELHFNEAVAKDDTITVVYRCSRPIEEYNIRTTRNNLTPPDIRWVHESTTGMTISEPDADGWVTATYTFGLSVDRGYNESTGKSDKNVKTIPDTIYSVVDNFNFHFHGTIVATDYIEIKEVRHNDTVMTIDNIAAAATAALKGSGDVVREADKVEKITAGTSAWTGATTFVVQFLDPLDLDSDSNPKGTAAIVASGEPVAEPTALTREGKVFGGWNTKKDGSGDAWTFTTAIEKDTILYAVWTEPTT